MLDHSQVVAVGGELSTINHTVLRGPQGSVLGPLFFTIYINDVARQISPSSSISYADDSALYHSPALLQADITAIVNYVEVKNLKFNTSKCSAMLISRKRSLLAPLY